MRGSSVELFGCRIDALTMDETIKWVVDTVKAGIPKQHVVVNVAKMVHMRNDSVFKDIINSCDLVNVDGMPIVWASRLLGRPLPCRVAGVDLFQNLVELSTANGFRPFFFGAREAVVTKVVDVFQNRYPDLDVAGYRNGYYAAAEEQKIAEHIKASQADLLFVGFSSPMKEKFLNRWMPFMQVPFCMGVGGSFDIVAGKTKRAPVWMQECGLEWFYRILQEPGRMWHRYARTNPVFVLMVLKALYEKQATGNPVS